MLCFNICFIHGYKIARISSHSLIRYWMSNKNSDAKACFSSKVEYRAVIRYLYLKDKSCKELHGALADVYGSSALSYTQVKFWVGEFKHDRTSLEDEARSGRPLDATDEEMCKKVRDLYILIGEFRCRLVDNPMTAAVYLNSDRNVISQWAASWLVLFNPAKTESLIFTRKLNKPVHPPLYMNDQH